MAQSRDLMELKQHMEDQLRRDRQKLAFLNTIVEGSQEHCGKMVGVVVHFVLCMYEQQREGGVVCECFKCGIVVVCNNIVMNVDVRTPLPCGITHTRSLRIIPASHPHSS